MQFVLTLEDVIGIICVCATCIIFVCYWTSGFILEFKTRREKKKKKEK